MESGLELSNLAALAGVLVVGASVPSLSVLTVSARSAALGFAHGALTSAGIVVGDIVFILIAIYGLSALATLMGDQFVLIKYLGGAYLIWLGVMLWRSTPQAEREGAASKHASASSFLTGLLITLGDQKAILLYFGLFPAFVNPAALSPADTLLILAVATIAVGGPKLFYAFLAGRVGNRFRTSKVARSINVFAGSVMVGVGGYLLVWG